MSTPPSSGSFPSTADLVAWDRAFVWHPFTPMKPWCETKDVLVIARGEREFLYDTQGRRYLDGVSSLWCNVHGHCVPELDEAVRAQLAQVAHSTLLGAANVPSILLAKRLVELARARGLGLDKVFYSDNGSTSVEVACKMAYQYWHNQGETGRTRFLAFESAYHGDTLGAVSVGGIPLFHHAFKSLCFPVDFVPAPDPADGGAASLREMERLLAAHEGAYAAIVAEPLVLGAGGMHMYPASVLPRLRALADRFRTLLVFDEVLTGFGRTGTMFAAEQGGAQGTACTPDFMCLSKGLTAGYMPLGVTLTTQKIFQGFYVDPGLPGNLDKTFFHGHTFTGHPLACAVALASLDLFERNGLLEHVRSLAPLLRELLDRATAHPCVRNPRMLGLIAAFDLCHADGTRFPTHWRIAAELCTRLREKGLLLRPLAETMVIMPPLAIARENLAYLCGEVVQGLGWVDGVVRARQEADRAGR